MLQEINKVLGYHDAALLMFSNDMVNRNAEMLLHYSEDTCTYWWTDDSLRMEYCTIQTL